MRKIINIKKIDRDIELYNLHVEKNNNYICNGVVVHNCHTTQSKPFLSTLDNLTNIEYRYGFTGTIPKDRYKRMKIISRIGKINRVIDIKELITKDLATPVNIKSIFLYHSCVNIYDREMEKQYIYRCDDRYKIIYNLISSLMRKNHNTILYVNDIKYGSNTTFKKIIEQHVDCNVFLINKETKKDKFLDIKKYIESNKKNVIISTYKLASTGISIKNIDSIVFGQPIGRDFIKLMQTIGRGVRKFHNKRSIDIYDFVDIFKKNIEWDINQKHYLQRLKYYKQHEFNISRSEIIL